MVYPLWYIHNPGLVHANALDTSCTLMYRTSIVIYYIYTDTLCLLIMSTQSCIWYVKCLCSVYSSTHKIAEYVHVYALNHNISVYTNVWCFLAAKESPLFNCVCGLPCTAIATYIIYITQHVWWWWWFGRGEGEKVNIYHAQRLGIVSCINDPTVKGFIQMIMCSSWLGCSIFLVLYRFIWARVYCPCTYIYIYIYISSIFLLCSNMKSYHTCWVLVLSFWVHTVGLMNKTLYYNYVQWPYPIVCT